MLLAGFLVSMIIYVNTKEKTVQAKTHRTQIRFIDAFKAVARNKYFWIISLAGWIGFLEIGFLTHIACRAEKTAVVFVIVSADRSVTVALEAQVTGKQSHIHRY